MWRFLRSLPWRAIDRLAWIAAERSFGYAALAVAAGAVFMAGWFSSWGLMRNGGALLLVSMVAASVALWAVVDSYRRR